MDHSPTANVDLREKRIHIMMERMTKRRSGGGCERRTLRNSELEVEPTRDQRVDAATHSHLTEYLALFSVQSGHDVLC